MLITPNSFQLQAFFWFYSKRRVSRSQRFLLLNGSSEKVRIRCDRTHHIFNYFKDPIRYESLGVPIEVPLMVSLASSRVLKRYRGN